MIKTLTIMKNYNGIITLGTCESFRNAQKRAKKLYDVSEEIISDEMNSLEFKQFLQTVLDDARLTYSVYNCEDCAA